MFHVKDGLYFDRQPNGDVRIIKRADDKPDSQIVFAIDLDQASFASAICNASKDQEQCCQWYAAMEILSGKFHGGMEEYRKQKEGLVRLLQDQGYHEPGPVRCSKCHDTLG